MTHWLDTVVVLLTSETANLRELALLAGGDPRTFYLGVDTQRIDFFGQNIEGMSFSGPVASVSTIPTEPEESDVKPIPTSENSKEAQDLAHMLAEARKENARASQFVAHISYELRTPLNNVIGIAEMLLKDANLSARQREYIDAIKTSGAALNSIVSDLAELSSLAKGKEDLHTEAVDVSALIMRTAKALASCKPDKGIKIETVIDGYIGTISTNAKQFEHILNNVVANAIDASNKLQSVLIRASTQKRLDQRTLLVEVIDSAGTLPKEVIAEGIDGIIERDRGATLRKSVGRHLGLSSALKLVRELGGDMGAKNANGLSGQGCNFWFTVPDVG